MRRVVIHLSSEAEEFWVVHLLEPVSGYTTFYGRLSEVKVKLGSTVEEGQPIGVARATSPICLRFGVIRPGSDKISDPRAFLPSMEPIRKLSLIEFLWPF